MSARDRSKAKPKEPQPRLPADATSAGPLPARVGAPAKGASILLVAGFGILVACLFLFGTVAEGIRDGEVFLLDTIATPFLHGLANPALDQVMSDATTMGSTAVLPALFAVAMILLLARRRFGAALFLAVSSGGALLLNELMKLFFHRPRPQLPWAHVQPDYSFPSGHTMNSVAFYLAIAIIVWSIAGRRWGAITLAAAIVLCTTIGVSRIYLGFHYFTDVTGGALAGIAWVLVTLAAFRTRPLAALWDGPSAARHRASRGSS
ncbi:MAG TPA: phosphatase PAP2 family protein [Candidatus Limnocylindrales bacterium]|nr:phosphatase PAP2 family protein [Candidatus Limnocylindrales bacterium]